MVDVETIKQFIAQAAVKAVKTVIVAVNEENRGPATELNK